MGPATVVVNVVVVVAWSAFAGGALFFVSVVVRAIVCASAALRSNAAFCFFVILLAVAVAVAYVRREGRFIVGRGGRREEGGKRQGRDDRDVLDHPSHSHYI